MNDPRLEAELQQARRGRSMVAVWRVQNGRLLLYRKTQNFPLADFSKAVELLWQNLQQAAQPRPAAAALWLPPGATSRDADAPTTEVASQDVPLPLQPDSSDQAVLDEPDETPPSAEPAEPGPTAAAGESSTQPPEALPHDHAEESAGKPDR